MGKSETSTLSRVEILYRLLYLEVGIDCSKIFMQSHLDNIFQVSSSITLVSVFSQEGTATPPHTTSSAVPRAFASSFSLGTRWSPCAFSDSLDVPAQRTGLCGLCWQIFVYTAAVMGR